MTPFSVRKKHNKNLFLDSLESVRVREVVSGLVCGKTKTGKGEEVG